MIDAAFIAAEAARLGVPDSQVRRDHLISHILLASSEVEGFAFFGGTALHRTHLPNGRLSEDIDLYALTPDHTWSELLDAIPSSLRREFPDLRVSMPTHFLDVATYQVTIDDMYVQLQAVGYRSEYSSLESARTPVRLSYPDLPATAILEVPSLASFVALKLSSYIDRRAPRDLFDLAELADRGAFSDRAANLFRELTGYRPDSGMLPSPPPRAQWYADLAHQVVEPGDPSLLHDIVERSLDALREQ